jgi:hypothetical protein
VRIIEQYYAVELDKETLEFMRFSSHVRNLVIEYIIPSARANSRGGVREYEKMMTNSTNS